jgi:hypothetical protein
MADSRATGSATETSWHPPATRGLFWTVMYKIDSEPWVGWPLVAQHGPKRTECLRTQSLVVVGSSPTRPTAGIPRIAGGLPMPRLPAPAPGRQRVHRADIPHPEGRSHLAERVRQLRLGPQGGPGVDDRLQHRAPACFTGRANPCRGTSRGSTTQCSRLTVNPDGGHYASDTSASLPA